MKNYIEKFPEQLEEALSNTSAIKVPNPNKHFNNIVIVGMGGSAFGSEVVKTIVKKHSPIPMTIIRNYELPNFVNENSLLIFSSYSGNTEETLSAMYSAKNKNIPFLAISSNGTLQNETKKENFFQLPKGYPPRTAIAFSIITLLEILFQYNLIPDYKNEIKNTITLLKTEDFTEKALFLTEFIRYKFPILYVPNIFQSVGIRFQQQLNENSKILAHYGVVPEMNHNEIVGWLNANKFNDNIRFILLKSNLMHQRTKHRFQFMEDYLKQNFPKYYTTIEAKGNSLLQQIFYSIHLIDWVSYYLSNKFNVDPVSVEIIDKLKSYLKNL